MQRYQKMPEGNQEASTWTVSARKQQPINQTRDAQQRKQEKRNDVNDPKLGSLHSHVHGPSVISTEHDVHTFKTHHHDPILIKNFYKGSDKTSIRFW
jgi:hypothetical protein